MLLLLILLLLLHHHQLLLLLPGLSSWMQFTAQAAGQLGATPMLRG